jgi:hypothetical protein
MEGQSASLHPASELSVGKMIFWKNEERPLVSQRGQIDSKNFAFLASTAGCICIEL